MSTRRDRPRSAPFRALPGGPAAVVLGTAEEIAVLEPVVRQARMGLAPVRIDPLTLDVEQEILDEGLAARVESASLAVVLLDVSGDDRLPLISAVDDALPPSQPLLVSCTQAGATEQAAICKHRSRVVGLGILGLLSGRKVVELAPGLNTSTPMVERAARFFLDTGHQVFRVNDAPGLVLTRILAPIVNEAALALTEGLASPEEIDQAMRLGANFPFGPLAWADQLGLDRLLLAMEYLVQATYEERYRPAPLLRRLAQAGFTGKAAGRGFYSYPAPGPRPASQGG